MSETLDQPTPSPLRLWFYPLIIVLTTFVVCWQLVPAEFLAWDEQFNIWQNPDLNPPTLQTIGKYWREEFFGLYIPLTYTVWGLLALVARLDTPDPRGITLNPAVFHLSSILLHVCSALVVYRILIRLLKRDHRAACIGAMLFAIHPIQVEPVAWVAGLKDVMAGMFALIAVWQYITYAQSTPTRKLNYVVATLAFILAMLSKPSAMVTPGIVLAIDWLLLKRPIRQIIITVAPWLGLTIICALVARMVQPAIGIESAPLWVRPFVVGDSLAFYFYKLVWPLNLAPDYGHRPAAVVGQWWFYLTWIVPIGLFVLLTVSRKRRPELLTAGIIFVVGVAPMLGLLTFLFQHFSTTADHYLYLSMLGAALATGYVASRFRNGAVAVVMSLWLSLLGIRSYLQTRYWQDDATIWSHTIDVNPHSFMAMNNLGVLLIGQRDYATAQQYLEQAVKEYSGYVQAYDNLALALVQQGRSGEAIVALQNELRAQLSRPVEVRGDLVPPLRKLAEVHIQLRHFNEAAACLEQARKYDPNNPEVLQVFQRLREEMSKVETKGPATFNSK